MTCASPAPAGLQAAGQVDVDDVEAAGAEPEVERLDVDDDLVALLALARRVRGRPRPPALARRPRPSSGVGRDDDRRGAASASLAPGGELEDRFADGEHLGQSRSPATRSVAVWLSSVPLASSTASKPRAISALASLPPPVASSRRLDPAALAAPRGRAGRAGALGAMPVAAEHLDHVDVDVAAVIARGPGAGSRPSPRVAAATLASSSERASPRSGSARRRRSRRSRRRSRRRSPSSPRRGDRAPSPRSPPPRRRSRCGPSSGRIPACASTPVELGDRAACRSAPR